MKEIIENGKYTCINEIGEVICTIENLGNNIYKVINKSTQVTAEIKPIDDYKTSIKCIENKKADKNGIFRKNKTMINHNTKWLVYMLEEKGFIRKSRAIGK